MPSDWKIQRHSRPETAVGTAHGTRMLARRKDRPRKARFMARARQRPRTVSRNTVVTVKNVVLPKALRKRRPDSPTKRSA